MKMRLTGTPAELIRAVDIIRATELAVVDAYDVYLTVTPPSSAPVTPATVRAALQARREPAMTDQQLPELDDEAVRKAAAAVREAFEPLAATVRDAWTKVRPALETAAHDAETLTATYYALGAAFTGDGVREQLAKLDAGQLADVFDAAQFLARAAAEEIETR